MRKSDKLKLEEIPKAPIKEGFKATFLWILAYKVDVRFVIMSFIVIVLIILMFSVFSISFSRSGEDGKIRIQDASIKPIDTKINVSTGGKE
jgi:hypothetical protein